MEFFNGPVDENNCHVLFSALDRVEDMLSKSKFLVGNTLTEADVRLFTSIVRYIISSISSLLTSR